MIKSIRGLSILELPLEYFVVGEHRRDSGRLLLQGDDGDYYEFRMDSNEITSVVPDFEWNMESTTLPDLDLYVA